MTARSVGRALHRAVATRGVTGTLKRIPHYSREVLFDFRHRVQTVGEQQVGGRQRLDGSAGSYGYAPITISCFRSAMREFAVPAEMTFVDFGCGKGRALMLAASWGFPRVVGVEAVPEFCDQAERNVGRYLRRHKLSPELQLFCSDAGAYEVQPLDATFFLFNPFPGDVLLSVLANIRRSVEDHPREIRVIYAYPLHRDEFDRDDFWRLAGAVNCQGFGQVLQFRPRG